MIPNVLQSEREGALATEFVVVERTYGDLHLVGAVTNDLDEASVGK